MIIFRITALIFLVFFSLFSHSETIKEIKILGIDSISRGTILNYLPLEIGDDINKENLDDAKNSLLKTNLFSNIELSLVADSLIISVIENPTIKFLEFKGYSEDEVLSVEIIESLKNNLNLNVGSIFIKNNLDTLLNQIINLYQSESYFKAKVTPKVETDEKNRIGIVLNIDEDERALISSFKISGSSLFEEEDLLDEFDMGEPDFFLINYFTKFDSYSKLKLEAGIEKIKNKYTSQGYLEIKIEDVNVNYDKDNNEIQISIFLSEGKLFKLGNIIFSGDTKNFSEEKLRSFFTISKGDSFKRDQLISSIRKIEDEFKNLGFAYTKINPRITPNDDFLDVNIEVTPDSLIYIGRINITGNNRTQDDVIRRKIQLNEGSPYSRSDISESINKIKRLGYFSDVKYEIKRRLHDKDISDIEINVTETKTGEISIGLSHSNSTGASINAGIKQSNILGTGNTLNASYSNSSAVDEVSFYFKNPYFNKDGHSISYGFVNKKIDASNLDASSYQIDESGLVFGYGIPTSEISNIFGEILFSTIDLTCGADLASTYEIADCASNDELDLKVNLSYTSNSLNDAFFPTDGTYTNLSSVLGLPFGDFKYLKLESNYKNYTPVLERQTLKLSTRVNFATGYGGDELPFFKRYYEGGTSSIRGFDFNSLGAKYSNDKPKGGQFSFVSSTSIASPADIIGLNNENIRIFAFLDAGSISEKISDIKFDDIRSSVGVGLSWLTPIGPIGINLAKPIIKKTSDSTQSFAFDLGAKF